MIDKATVIARLSKAYVYGFRLGGHWLYVGSTLDPDSRRQKLVKRYKHLRSADFLIIRPAPLSQVSRIEKQVICSLKNRGQCVFNLARSGARPCDVPGAGAFLWLETGLRFESYREIDRAFRVGSSKIVKCAFNRANGQPFQLHCWRSSKAGYVAENLEGVTFQDTTVQQNGK